MNTWNIEKVELKLKAAFENNSERELLDILKYNSFLFYELYSRKHGIQPNFAEISFGDTFRCDFTWLNDNSMGPEWVLVEVEAPKIRLFNAKKEPTATLNHSIEQLKSWDKYFLEFPHEKTRIFGAVQRFRFILVGGDKESWMDEHAIKWRAYNNNENKIEIRTSDVFMRALQVAKENFKDLWSFEEHPVSLSQPELEKYWTDYKYMDLWRKTFK
jgi:hypothetical protein